MVKTQSSRRRADVPGNTNSLAQIAYERIKQAVLSGELRAGDYLNVAQLCTRLRLGRSPVHQAVQRLAQDGLMEIKPRKGVSIRAESWEDSLQIEEARKLLAPALAGMAARRADSQAIARMERLLHERKSAKTRDRVGMLALDLAFHEELFAAGGNPLLAQMAARVHERAVRLAYSRLQSARQIAERLEGLGSILLAVRNGDEMGADGAMRRFIEGPAKDGSIVTKSAVA